MTIGATASNLAWLAASMPVARRFRRALHDPMRPQLEKLRGYLQRGAATDYGRAYGLGEIRTYDDFAARVPIIDYDDLAPWIHRLQGGERAVLTGNSVTRLLPTSGSTAARKLIPFTAELQREFNAAIGPWVVDLYAQHPALAFGRAYWSLTPSVRAAEVERSAVPIGFEDDSQYLGGARARLVECTMAVPSAVRHIGDTAAFRHVVLLSLLACPDLRLISVWHPSFLSLLLDALPQQWDALLDDLRKGTLSVGAALPAQVRTALHLRPRPRAAARLRHADPTQPNTIWPLLRVVSCWADGNAIGPAAELQRRIPQVALQPKGLLATEAFVTLPFSATHPVAICSHFFEFADRGGKIHVAEQLRVGECYEVIVTTAAGLWRYRLGDRIEVTGFIGRTPCLRFLGRAHSLSDRCGEKLSEAFVGHAIRTTCISRSLAPNFALLAPDFDGRVWRYTLYLQAKPTAGIEAQLEAELRANPHYAWCRDVGQLGPLAMHWIDRNGYETYTAAEMARGLRLGDIKPVALSSRTDWREWFGGAAEKRLTLNS